MTRMVGITKNKINKNMKNTTDILICDCNSTEHQIVIYYDKDEYDSLGITIPMCYFHIHLNKRPFWE